MAKTSNDSNAINEAIQHAVANGGGTVLVPAGIYRSGSIILASNINLHLEAGAIIRGSHDINDYPAQDKMVDTKDANVHHLIIADKCQNVALTGRGMIDGQGFAFWKPQESPRAWIRHNNPRVSPCVEITDCQDVAIEDVTIHESLAGPCTCAAVIACAFVVCALITIATAPTTTASILMAVAT